jgi:hypothetical protein
LLSREPNDIAELEYQEMRAVLDAMESQNIPSRYLQTDKRNEVEALVRKVATERPTAIPLKSVKDVLPGTEWRLAFSTETATLGDLPKDAQVKLHFVDDSKVDYILEFSQKTLGIRRLVAKSSYSVDCTNVNPGLVTFVYDEIVTDLFGFKNIGVGFFGLLKGRANYVETIFMDTRYWIERGYTPDGRDFFNVYIRSLNTAEAETHGRVSSVSTTLPIISTEDQWE